MRTKATFHPIENPIDAKYFSTFSGNVSSDYILFVGKVDDRKSPLHILMAYKKIAQDFSEIRIKIVGSLSDTKYFKLLEQYCQDNKLNTIEFTGPKSSDEILSLYKNALFLVLPSRQEAAPMVIAEAMACGKPVIASNVSGIPWMVTEGKTGFLYEYGDIDQLAVKMRILLEDVSLRNDFGRKAQAEAYQRFHPDKVVKKTLELYKQILQKG